MKIYILILILLALFFWGNKPVMLWIACISVFIPIKYAKDFTDKRLH